MSASPSGRDCSALQMLVEVASIGAVHLHLSENLKVRIVFGFGEIKDFFVRAGLLSAELIAGKAQHRDGTALLKGTQTCVLRREPSLTR